MKAWAAGRPLSRARSRFLLGVTGFRPFVAVAVVAAVRDGTDVMRIAPFCAWLHQIAAMTHRVTVTNDGLGDPLLDTGPSVGTEKPGRGKASSQESDDRPRKMRTLVALCVSQIGGPFVGVVMWDDLEAAFVDLTRDRG